MPDDSSPDFRAAQSKHADEIKMTRALSQKTGVPFNRIRQALKDFAETQQSRQAEATRNAPPVPVSQTLPSLPDTRGKTMEFRPNPFPSDSPRGGGGAGAPSSVTAGADITGVTMVVVDPVGPTVTMYVDCTIKGELGTAVP